MSAEPIKRALRRVLRRFNLDVVKHDVLLRLVEAEKRFEERPEQFDDVRFLLGLPGHQVADALQAMAHSTSQIRQDVFALCELDFKRGGFFVEFGASNGIFGSNSLMLERDWGWRGILAEPSRYWHEELRRNRRCTIDTRCVWKESGATIEFSEAPNPSLSGVSSVDSQDWASEIRKMSQVRYGVETISLSDLLAVHGAPRRVDYLSVDTEGSELEILRACDFDAWQFGVITCEHNRTRHREEVHELLSAHGYRRKFEELTGFEDWYVGPPN